MKAAVPVTSPLLYKRAIELMKPRQKRDFKAHPLKVLIGLLLKRSEIASLGSDSSTSSKKLQDLLYDVYSKREPFDQGVGREAFINVYGGVKRHNPGDNDWRNSFNSQKGLGCFASETELQDLDFRHATRVQCPHRGLGGSADLCSLTQNGTPCRQESEGSGEVPKLLKQVAVGGGSNEYQLVVPLSPDLAKLKRSNNELLVSTWALIAVLYSGSPHLHKGRSVITNSDLMADLGLDPASAGSIFDEMLSHPHNREIAKMTEPVLLACLRRRMYDNDGFVISFPDLINFYLSLKPRSFVILTGISGTGKSRLPRLFAQEIRSPGSDSDSNFKQIPVQPNWNDATSLMGFYNSLHEGFEPGPAIDAFRKAHEAVDKHNGDAAGFLLLDELNLARVEHYFADFLSVMESRRLEDGEWITDPLELAGGRTGNLLYMGQEQDSSKMFENYVPAQMPIPDNLFTIGTVNIDESTQGISNKVLDRANTIEFEEVYLALPKPPPIPMAPDGEDLCANADLSLLSRHVVARPYRTFAKVRDIKEDLVKEYLSRLEEMNKALRKWRCHFGNRTRDDICMYLAYAEDFCTQAEAVGVDLEGYDMSEALDRQILQKILPRVRGTREELENGPENSNLFVELNELLDGWGCKKSVEKLERMRTQDTVNFWEA